jgi:hypothetical protein
MPGSWCVRRWRGSLSTGVAVLSLLLDARASELIWHGPEDCSDSRSTVEEAERLLGRRLAEIDVVDFDVTIEQLQPGRWSLRLAALERKTGEKRERVVEGASCSEVTAAAAVALAMVINAGEANSASVAEPVDAPPSLPQATTARAEPEAAERPRAEPPREKALSGAVSLGVVADWGAMPTVAPGGEVATAVDYGAWRVTALGAILLSPRHDVEAGKGGEFGLSLGALLGCGHWRWGRAEPLLCLGAELGRLSGTGTGVRRAKSGESLWWGPRAELGVLVPLAGRFSLLARAGAVFPQIRKDFTVDDDLLVNRPSAVSGRATLGVELGLD